MIVRSKTKLSPEDCEYKFFFSDLISCISEAKVNIYHLKKKKNNKSPISTLSLVLYLDDTPVLKDSVTDVGLAL